MCVFECVGLACVCLSVWVPGVCVFECVGPGRVCVLVVCPGRVCFVVLYDLPEGTRAL